MSKQSLSEKEFHAVVCTVVEVVLQALRQPPATLGLAEPPFPNATIPPLVLKSLELRQVALSLASNCAHTQEDMITTAKRFMDFLQQGT